MAIVDDIIARFSEQQDKAREANERRYAEALELYDRIIKQYEPGGAFGAGVEAQLGREKVRTVASQTQQLVSSGLFGTSVTAGLGQKFEEEVGAPTRLKAQDIAFERLAQAGVGKAGLIERREDVGPDYATIAQLTSQIGQATPADRTGGRISMVGGGRTSYVSAGPDTSTWGLKGQFERGRTGATVGSPSSFATAGGAATTQPTGSGLEGWDWKKGVSGAYSGRGKELTDTGWTFMGDMTWRRRHVAGGVDAKSLMQQADPYNISGRTF